MKHRSALVGTVIYRGKLDQPVDNATEEEILEELAAIGLTEERIERIFVNMERNEVYFQAHQWELFERYPDKLLLIHSGGVVETFDEICELTRRREELDQDAADGAIRRRQRKGIWVL